MDVIRQSSSKVAEHYSADADDLAQEAAILVTTKPDLVECLGDEPRLGLLAYRLEQDLVSSLQTDKRRADLSESYDTRNDTWTGVEMIPPNQEWAMSNVVAPQPTYVSSYTVELVEALLPAVWDPSYCYGVRAENAPDPDMPRGSTNKATGNTAAAHFADIKRAWEKCNLTPSERQALFLRYCRDLTQKDSAKVLVCSQSVVSNWLASGLERLLVFLNGDGS